MRRVDGYAGETGFGAVAFEFQGIAVEGEFATDFGEGVES